MKKRYLIQARLDGAWLDVTASQFSYDETVRHLNNLRAMSPGHTFRMIEVALKPLKI